MGKGVRSACSCSVWRALGKASWNAGCLGCRSKPSAGQAHNSILSGNCPIWQAAPKQVLTTVGRVGGRHHQIREDGCRESSTQQLRDGCGCISSCKRRRAGLCSPHMQLQCPSLLWRKACIHGQQTELHASAH